MDIVLSTVNCVIVYDTCVFRHSPEYRKLCFVIAYVVEEETELQDYSSNNDFF